MWLKGLEVCMSEGLENWLIRYLTKKKFATEKPIQEMLAHLKIYLAGHQYKKIPLYVFQNWSIGITKYATVNLRSWINNCFWIPHNHLLCMIKYGLNGKYSSLSYFVVSYPRPNYTWTNQCDQNYEVFVVVNFRFIQRVFLEI